MQIAIITGEASGDRVGGQLAEAIRTLRPDADIWGTGGKFLQSAGAQVVIDSSRLGVVGMAQGLRVLPKILHLRRRLLQLLLQRRPDVLVAVDAGALHLGFGMIEGVCFWTRRHLPNTRILYYFPPGSWRRTLKGTSLDQAADRVATPFPWSETELRRLGADAHFVGHPLLDLVHPSRAPEEFAKQHGIDRARPVVGLLPGSRSQEITHILPVLLDAAAMIHQRVPGVQFLIALAPTVDQEQVIRQVRHCLQSASQRNRLRLRRASQRKSGSGDTPGAISVPVPATGRALPPDELARREELWLEKAAELPRQNRGDLAISVVEDATYDVMAASDVLLTTSGTATLEAAILQKPMVIVYRLSEWNRLEYQLVKHKLPPFVGMPNLIAGRQICRELLQEAATPEAIADEAIGLLLQPDRQAQMRRDLKDVVAQLGERGGAGRAAQMVVDLAEKKALTD